MNALSADRTEIERFVNVLFKHADEGAYVSLRTFDATRTTEDHARSTTLWTPCRHAPGSTTNSRCRAGLARPIHRAP